MRHCVQTLLRYSFLGLLSLSCFTLGWAQSTVPIYTVKSGDTLFKIAKANGVSVDELIEWNGLNGSLILVGQSLVVEDPLQVRDPEESGSVAARETETYTGPSYQQARLAKEPYEPAHLSDLFDNTPSVSTPSSTSQYKAAPSESVTVRSVNTSSSAKRIYYLVKPNENLNQIAQRFGVSAAELRQQNRLLEVVEGQTIVIKQPAQSARVAEASNPPQSDMQLQTLLGGQAQQTRSALPQAASQPGAIMGQYEVFELRGAKARFYIAHKTLPVGTPLTILLPNNHGQVTVQVAATLSPTSRALIGVSPALDVLLNGNGETAMVELMY